MSDTPYIDVQLRSAPLEHRPLAPFPAAGGAECVFFGRTRDDVHPEHGRLERLSYEAYESMATSALERLARDAIERFGCLAVRIHHALGDVPLGDASVIVQVACGHRAESFEACRFLIDQLKVDVPIWKQERWQDGTSWSSGAPVTTP